ncbi:hypothetical protein [Streptomyces sp. NPDC054783]
MTLINRFNRKHDDARPKRRLGGLATAVASAVVVAGGVMLPVAAATAAPMHQTSAVTMTPRHDHHDGDYWSHDWDHHYRHHHCGDVWYWYYY